MKLVPFRTVRRMGQDVRAWPMLALLLLIVLVAIGCVLWFMREAMRNERMAVRQRLADAYRSQLGFVQKGVEDYWMRLLETLDEPVPASTLFVRTTREGKADSLICLNPTGLIDYPKPALNPDETWRSDRERAPLESGSRGTRTKRCDSSWRSFRVISLTMLQTRKDGSSPGMRS
jgi:hypothetical protein